MRLLIIGSLAGELGRAAALAAKRGASVLQSDTIGTAIEILRRDASIDLVFCDVRNELDRLISGLRAEHITVGVIACGLDSDSTSAGAAIRSGAQDFLPLPPDADLIAALLERAARQAHTLVGRDPTMLAVVRRAELIAPSNASILITGESGTGKEVFARYVHEKSRRSAGPFVAINCAAVPENLLESELFGHEKGAFSGAVARRVGKFEAASGGTLLLDEISEMDLRLQAKLLRAIQEREIDRLGGTSPVRIDVRIIATSNRDMQAEVDSSRFRSDLFFRLNVVNVDLPPLRQRPTDIPILAAFYASHYAALNGMAEKEVSRTALDRMQAYGWPGNVRELENRIHRAVLLEEGQELTTESIGLPPASHARQVEAAPPREAGSAAHAAPIIEVSNLVGCSVEEVERALIIRTLDETLGNRTHAAAILGISIRALRNKLRDYTRLGFEVHAPHAGVSA